MMNDKVKTILAVLATLFFVILPFGVIYGFISFKLIGATFIILFDILAVVGGLYLIYIVVLTFKEGFVDKDRNAIALGILFGFLLSCYVFLVLILVVSTPNVVIDLMTL